MPTIAEIADFLEVFAPARLAEDWDNVGLLVGDPQRPARRAMTCLTVTALTAAEAIRERADLIVTHHPLPFQPLRRITVETPEGRLLWDLISSHVAVYSPHTAFDSAAEGINQRLAEGLGLREIVPLVQTPESPPFAKGGLLVGAGRRGDLAEPTALAQLVERLKRFLSLDHVQLVGDAGRQIRRVAVACGSAGEFLGPAVEQDCECLVTGEARFHTCLAAEALGVALLLSGHYASERFAVEYLADVLEQRFTDADIWASRDERDPLRWI